eukprot:TRINITY_DN13554_c0_g1_i1.p1 TRINITY_DN13554_c0_g1~~TRINITY_DN13554_c0_g1_i1.p1  ORF type:complete len:236 (+),score=48.23 TRINITY_DN13554_c0_g1_i1:31-708(+)
MTTSTSTLTLTLLAISLSLYSCSTASASAIEEGTSPSSVWPSSFNATMFKVTEKNTLYYWTKFFYDYTQRAIRFDFYNDYNSLVNTGNTYQNSTGLNCTILFVNNHQVSLFPEEKACNFRAGTLPVFPPDWIDHIGGHYLGEELVRGMMSDKFSMPDPDSPQEQMVYYSRRSFDPAQGWQVPVRTQNQVNDPGYTDFFDVIVGDQLSSYFDIPDFCKTLTESGCG